MEIRKLVTQGKKPEKPEFSFKSSGKPLYNSGLTLLFSFKSSGKPMYYLGLTLLFSFKSSGKPMYYSG